jgi:hypothetical protein
MTISSVTELEEQERRIARALERYELPEVLISLETLRGGLKPFVAAGVALFAVRFARPSILREEQIAPQPTDELEAIARMVTEYLLADPFSFDPSSEPGYHGSVMIPVLYRHLGNQTVYSVERFGQYARALKLFRDIPNRLRGGGRRFDFEGLFLKLNHVALTDFVDIGFTCYAAAKGQVRFAAGYFDVARGEGVRLPDDATVARALDLLAGDQFRLRELYEEYKQKDRRYGAYDYNPLFVHPMIRPWPKREDTAAAEDRLTAQLPELILTRLSEGIYQQLEYKYRKAFTDDCGPVFEAYVGEILAHAFPGAVILSEKEIRKTYPAERGKAPDWAVIVGGAVFFFECKGTTLSRKAVATGDQKAIDATVQEVGDGLVQLHQFRDACMSGAAGLEPLHGHADYRAVVVTFGPVHLINSAVFSDVIQGRLAKEGITAGQWHALSAEQLEILQPVLAAAVDLSAFLDELRTRRFGEFVDEIYAKTGVDYQDSFLYEMDREIYDRLKVPLVKK